MGIKTLSGESSLAMALEFLAGCVAGAAVGVALAFALGAKDCGLSVAGKCRVLPHPVMRIRTTTAEAGMQIRCIDLRFPGASRLSEAPAQSKTDTRA